MGLLRFRGLLQLLGLAAILVVTLTTFNGWPLLATAKRHASHRVSLDPRAKACDGHDGHVVRGGLPDELIFRGPLPKPFAGSYEELGLKQSWNTATSRYGPYATRVRDWNRVNWASLQNACVARNEHRFGKGRAQSAARRFVKNDAAFWNQKGPSRSKTTTGRTAIVVRAHSEYIYAVEDFLYLRSLITETALASGGDYSVFLLVDVKGEHNIWDDPAAYDAILDQVVPPEFRDIAVLFNQQLLKTVYHSVREHRPVFQVIQPLQLFAEVFDEFDYYWQLEMDVRFTGHAGHLLTAASRFARQEPRKQAVHRATYFYTQNTYGTYKNFTRLVNAAVDGTDPFYHGISIPDIAEKFLWDAPATPMKPELDDFSWGVGEDADLVLLSPTMNVTLDTAWHSRAFIFNFSQGIETPRIHSPPAMGRASWNLLNTIHQAQRVDGLAVPSEATLPSFALWHGMKISLPPLPIYSRMDRELGFAFMDIWCNGGTPKSAWNGMARGQSMYGRSFLPPDDPEYGKSGSSYVGPSFRWATDYGQDLNDAWMKGDVQAQIVGDGRVPTLKIYDKRLWIPPMMLHPVKTNKQQENLDWLLVSANIPTG